MLRVHFSTEDLARTTIAPGPDPLWELLLSLHVLQQRSESPAFDAWRRQVRHRLSPSIRLIVDLAPPTGYSPDFLTPADCPPEVDAELERVAATSPRQVRVQLERLSLRRRPTAWTRSLAGDHRAAMPKLAKALRSYFHRCLTPFWPAIRRRVASDRAYRIGQLAGAGIGQVLGQLTPRARWRSRVLEVPGFPDADLRLDDRGLTLQPSYFCHGLPTKLWDPDLPPILVYPIAHTPGELASATDFMDGLAALLGRSRAAALEAIAAGTTTTQLAQTCHLSLAAASHQASVLRRAGLATTRRLGGTARHEITPLGLDLLNGREPDPGSKT